MFTKNEDSDDFGSATILINIIDMNDNSPYFYNVTESVDINEDVPIGTEIARIFASDVDTTHDEIVFSLAGGNVGYDFRIVNGFDQISGLFFGTILTQHELDSDLGTKFYTLKVRITDAAGRD